MNIWSHEQRKAWTNMEEDHVEGEGVALMLQKVSGD